MKKPNLVNKFIRGIFVFFDWFMILAGFTSIFYEPDTKTFEFSQGLRFYTRLMTAFCCCTAGLIIFAVLSSILDKRAGAKISIRFMLIISCHFITTLTRWQQLWRQQLFRQKLNDYLCILEDIRVVSKNPNLFTFSHLCLCLIGIQGAVRSICSESMLSEIKIFRFWVILWVVIKIYTCYIFIIMANGIFLMFVTLIACYDELHRCTKRISRDAKMLRCEQAMESHQLVKFMRELQMIMEDLIALRLKLHDMTVVLSSHFESVLLLAILYWIIQTTVFLMMASDGNPNPQERQHWNGVIMSIFTGVYNIGYFCFLGEVLKKKSRISRSYWNFHLTNVDVQFDKTVDEFVSTGFVENLTINIFNVAVTMKLFFKIIAIILLYANVYMNFSKRGI